LVGPRLGPAGRKDSTVTQYRTADVVARHSCGDEESAISDGASGGTDCDRRWRLQALCGESSRIQIRARSHFQSVRRGSDVRGGADGLAERTVPVRVGSDLTNFLPARADVAEARPADQRLVGAHALRR